MGVVRPVLRGSTVLTAQDDLNNLVTPGVYGTSGSEQPANMPEGVVWAVVLVIHGGGNVVQLVLRGGTSGGIWLRTGGVDGTNWQIWKVLQ